MGKRWRTRTKGTKRQKGKHFILGPSMQKLKMKLKNMNPKTRSRIATVKARRERVRLARIKEARTETEDVANAPHIEEPETPLIDPERDED